MNGRSISVLHSWISGFAMESVSTRINWSVQVFDFTLHNDKM